MAVAIHLALAQVTLVLAAAFIAIGALTRWRPSWLLTPGLIGLSWALTIGAGRAWTGYAAAAAHLARFLAAPGSLFAHLRGAGAVAAGWQRSLPGQVPGALMAATVEAGVISLLAGHAEPDRPGPLAAVRRGYAVACLRRGEVATADGCCVGVSPQTGKTAAVSWREADGGVLVTGLDIAAVTGTCLDVVAAAILHRKSVLIIDLTDGTSSGRKRGRLGTAAVDASVLRSVAAVCKKAAAPLMVLRPGGACYEPFAEAGQADAAGLVTAMADWADDGPARRAFCADYVRAALEVIAAAAPAASGHPHRQACVLDDLAALLVPGAVPAWLSDRRGAQADPALGERVAALASQLAADPPATASLAAQLIRLRSSAAGAQLCPQRSAAAAGGAVSGTGSISLASALAERQVIVFPLDLRADGPAGLMVARLIIADLARVLTERDAVPADCVVWINGCEGFDPYLAAAIGGGQRAGVALVLGTASGKAAVALADHVNVVAVRGSPPRCLVARGTQASAPSGQDSQVLPAELLTGGRADALALLVRAPEGRLMPGCRVAR